MLIALTGGTGFIGRHIIERLCRRGDRVRCLARDSSDRTGFESAEGQLEWVTGELADGDHREFVEGCDAVVHAALDRPGRDFRGAEGNLVDFLNTNFMGSIRLMEAARLAGAGRFIFISTCAVHEKILDDRPLDETHPLWPRTHYGAHKAALEKFVHSYGLGHDFDICALRPSGVYGVARNPADSKWFEMIQSIVRGEPVTCSRGGKEVHAADVAQAVEVLLNASSVQGEAYSCCDQYISEFTVAHLARDISGSLAAIAGEQKSPRHQIVADKLCRLGMQFGGDAILRETVQQLVMASQS